MKATLSTLALYIYNKYLYEDWDDFKTIGKIVVYPFWLIRWVYVAVASPVLAIGYYWEKSEMYDMVQEARLESMVMMDQMMNQNKK